MVWIPYCDAIQPDPAFGIDRCANVIQYEDGLKIDFTLWSVELFERIVASPELPPELDTGNRMLLDKDSLTIALKTATGISYIPRPPTLSAYTNWINDFLSDAPNVAKCLWRDELMPAKWCLDMT